MNVQNISDILIHQSKKIPDKIAIFSDTKSYTYKQLDILVSKLATYLHQKGIRQKDVCLHYFDDEFLLILSMLALAKIGAILIAPNSKKPIENIDVSWTIDNSFIKLEDFQDINCIENFQIDTDETWQIVIGSGTTGKEKLFEVSHALEFEKIKISQSSLELSSSDIVTSLIPLNFYSTKIRFFATLFAGASYYILDKKITNLPKLLKEKKITVLYSTVFYTELILQSLSHDTKNCLDFLRVFSIGGSTVSEELKQKIKEKLTSNLYIGYGTNDIGGITCTSKETLFSTPQTVGKVLKNVTVQIVDKDGFEVPKGEIGHIRIKSPGMIQKYFNDEKNTEKFIKDGWFYPGDLGKFTLENELIYCGRADHMMILNGINIYPALIENRVLEHNEVEDAACIPLHDSINQDIPICAVVLKKGSLLTKAFLINFCYQKLSSASVKDIVILDTIPRNNLGKLQRKQLLDKIYPKLLFQDSNHFQPSKRFTIEINKQEIKNISRVFQWLQTVFGIDLKNLPTTNDIYTLSQISLYLVRKLLQMCKIPNFYLGSVASIKEETNSYSITIQIPYIDFIPVEFYTTILNNSFTFLYLMMDNKPTQENQNFFFFKYLQTLINPILKNNPQGKSQYEILKKAYENGIPFRHLGNGIFQLGFGKSAIKIDRSTTQNDSAIGQKLSTNKLATANILRHAGFPSATHGVASNPKEALNLANLLKYPLVIKPLDLDRGEGVSVNITNEQKLLKAFDYAYNLSPNKKVLIEQQAKGVCHRVFIAHGKFLYSVKRLPIGVYGDGKSSIEALIDTTNKNNIYYKDELALQTLKSQGYTFKSIPKKNSFVALREIETTQWGGVDEDVTHTIHQANIDMALKASNLIGLSVAGVDIITENISKPWYETDAIINEINFAPLLGGGEISKSYIDNYLQTALPNKGKIPIEIFIGEKQIATQKAKEKQNEYSKSGISCYFISSDEILYPNSNTLYLKGNSFVQRCESLLLDSDVEALVIVDENNLFYKEYYPFDSNVTINIL